MKEYNIWLDDDGHIYKANIRPIKGIKSAAKFAIEEFEKMLDRKLGYVDRENELVAVIETSMNYTIVKSDNPNYYWEYSYTIEEL